jgi:hypothetical protein
MFSPLRLLLLAYVKFAVGLLRGPSTALEHSWNTRDV